MLNQSCRRKAVNTSSTQSFSLMNLNLIISRVWRLKRRSTKSSGVEERTLLTFCCLLTVHERNMLLSSKKPHSSYFSWTHIDKTIKLWKVFERNIKVAQEYDNNVTARNGLFIPKISHQDNIVAAIPRRIYANGNIQASSVANGRLTDTICCIHSSCVPHQFDLSEL